MKIKNRLLIIGFAVLLMISAILVVDISIEQESKPFDMSIKEERELPIIPLEKGVFTRSAQALDYKDMPFDKTQGRSLSSYYKNRAFNGAPPTIPHELLSEKGIGGKTCLQCHENGGYVNQFAAFAPVTPHPTFINCKQCHVPQKTKQFFVSSNWKRPDPVAINQSAMPGSPPVIPHELQLRENCLSCHAGPSAAKEIRIDHAERVNCRQCHAAINSPEIEAIVFSRNPE